MTTATGPATSVGLVGVGTIADTHLAVLAEIGDVTVAFTVDPDPARSITFRHQHPPHYGALADALEVHQPDLVVIAAPTPTHAELTKHALIGSGTRVLVEKPLVGDLDALAMLRSLDTSVDVRSRVLVAHHFAFSPEVTWAADLIAEHPEWGPVTRITAVFHDPYIADADHSFAAYTSAWIDSGVNQLSMLTRFVQLTRRGRLHETGGGASAWCTVAFHSRGRTGTALLRASWQAIASSKHTTINLDETGTEIRLDHTAVTAIATQDCKVVHSLTNDGRTPRKIAHYRPLYTSVLSPNPDPAITYDTATHLTQLLHDHQPR